MLAKAKNDHANLNHFFHEFFHEKIKGTFMKFYEKKMFCAKKVTKLPDLTLLEWTKMPMPEPVRYQNKGTQSVSGTGLRYKN